jgi:putative MFS transporter
MPHQDISDLLDNLGLGKYQFTSIALMSGLILTDGAEMLLASGLARTAAVEFDASPIERGMAMAVLFVGLLLGSLTGGGAGDMLGRRPIILGAYFCVTVFGALCHSASTMSSLMIFRFGMGLGMGLGAPATMTLTIETVPTELRGVVYNAVGGIFVLGQMWAAIGLFCVMPDLEGPSWRILYIWAIAPGIVMLPFAYVYLKESPRWLLVNGKKAELDALLRYAALKNQKPTLDIKLDDRCYNTPQPIPGEQGHQNTIGYWDRFRTLYSPSLRNTTVSCSFLCFVGNFLLYGQMYALAQDFETMRHDWLSPAAELLVTSTFMLSGIFVAAVFLSLQEIGHVRSIAVCCFCCSALSCIMLCVDYGYPTLFDSAGYMYILFGVTLFNISYVYMPESFPSFVRQTGCGVCMSLGRLGSISAPIIFESLHEWKAETHAPYLLLTASLGCAGTILSSRLKLETKGMRLAEFMQSEMTQARRASSLKFRKKKDLPPPEYDSSSGESTPLFRNYDKMLP